MYLLSKSGCTFCKEERRKIHGDEPSSASTLLDHCSRYSVSAEANGSLDRFGVLGAVAQCCRCSHADAESVFPPGTVVRKEPSRFADCKLVCLIDLLIHSGASIRLADDFELE